MPRPPQFKAPQIPGGGNLGPALQAAVLVPQLVGAIGDAARDTASLNRAAFNAGQAIDLPNLAVALALPLSAPAAAAGLASRGGKPKGIPDWLWPFPDPPGPNDLPVEALDAGPVITPEGDPPFTGGQMVGAKYEITYTVKNRFFNRIDTRTDTAFADHLNLGGPIGGIRVFNGSTGGTDTGNTIQAVGANKTTGAVTWGNIAGISSSHPGGYWGTPISIISIARTDGQPDTGGDPPGTDPVRAPNPARQPRADAPPRTLPPPTPAPDTTDLPWPQVAPQALPPAAPQPTPFAEPPPAPNFTPTPTPEPVPPTAPGTTPTPTDLDSPRETPPNLADAPLTPPVIEPLEPIDETKPTGWLVNGKPAKVWGSTAPVVRVNGVEQETGANRLNPVNWTTAALAVAIPVVLLDGLRQKVNTPTANLTNKTAPNPNIKIVTPPPPPTVSTPNPPTCS
ncbi:MAG TPA: hypothetical protein VLO13_00310 [Halomonas sp.]|nr:hypothetical protein [Halomonas sp.]